MHRTVREGLVVGLIAYATVAVFYAGFDLLASRGTLYTVNLLGQTFFRGLRDPAVLGLPMPPDQAAIVWYNLFHLAASIAIGVTVTALVAHAEARPSRAAVVKVTIVAGFIVTVVVVGVLTTGIRRMLPWWSIVVANVSAVVLAGAYLVRARPGTWRRLSPFAL